jgi:ATP-dependent Lon protease
MKQSNTYAAITPIFPLPLVMFPSMELPLHIFEPRYKKMIEDIVYGDGTFGILRTEESSRSLAETGCLAKLTSITSMPDGRMNIIVQGLKRFSVQELVDGKPYKQGRITPHDEIQPGVNSLMLAADLKKILNDVTRLSSKLHGHDSQILEDCPDDPIELSYWIPARLYGSPSEQQRILNMASVSERLEAEHMLLDALRKQLAARTALKDAFKK